MQTLVVEPLFPVSEMLGFFWQLDGRTPDGHREDDWPSTNPGRTE